MKPFEYGDEEIGSREIGFAVSSTIIGIGALSMPRDIANQTLFSDGWIILLLGGLICAVLGWFVTRVAIYFQTKLCSIYECTFDKASSIHD